MSTPIAYTVKKACAVSRAGQTTLYRAAGPHEGLGSKIKKRKSVGKPWGGGGTCLDALREGWLLSLQRAARSESP